MTRRQTFKYHTHEREVRMRAMVGIWRSESTGFAEDIGAKSRSAQSYQSEGTEASSVFSVVSP
jgi:hypothetical protein